MTNFETCHGNTVITCPFNNRLFLKYHSMWRWSSTVLLITDFQNVITCFHIEIFHFNGTFASDLDGAPDIVLVGCSAGAIIVWGHDTTKGVHGTCARCQYPWMCGRCRGSWLRLRNRCCCCCRAGCCSCAGGGGCGGGGCRCCSGGCRGGCGGCRGCRGGCGCGGGCGSCGRTCCRRRKFTISPIGTLACDILHPTEVANIVGWMCTTRGTTFTSPIFGLGSGIPVGFFHFGIQSGISWLRAIEYDTNLNFKHSNGKICSITNIWIPLCKTVPYKHYHLIPHRKNEQTTNSFIKI